jgi:hypothetical protein
MRASIPATLSVWIGSPSCEAQVTAISRGVKPKWSAAPLAMMGRA